VRDAILKSSQGGYHNKARKLTTGDLETMEIPSRYWGAATGEIPEDDRAHEVAVNFAAHCPQILANGDPSLILIHGDAGTGKTSLAAILAKISRAHKYTVYWLDGSTILRQFPTNKKTADGELTARERAHETEVLVLDGLGQGYVTNDYVVAETSALLKYRQDHKMLTIATTSMGRAGLAKLYGTPFLGLLEEGSSMVKCIHEFRVHSSAGDDHGE